MNDYSSSSQLGMIKPEPSVEESRAPTYTECSWTPKARAVAGRASPSRVDSTLSSKTEIYAPYLSSNFDVSEKYSSVEDAQGYRTTDGATPSYRYYDQQHDKFTPLSIDADQSYLKENYTFGTTTNVPPLTASFGYAKLHMACVYVGNKDY